MFLARRQLARLENLLLGGPVFDLVTPSDRRLRGALSFSIVATLAVLLASRFLDRPEAEPMKALVWVAVAGLLAMASLLGTWSLLAALVERRPAWRDPLGRWAWAWAALSCAILGGLGWSGRASTTIGSAMLYGAGMLVVLSGIVGLTLSALPLRRTKERT